MDLKALIATAKAEVEEAEPVIVPVLLGGELVDVSLWPISGSDWADLTATHPPRKGSTLDSNVGFNSDAVARDYPVSRILVGGEPIKAALAKDDPDDTPTWPALVAALPAPSIKHLAAALWGMNQDDPYQRIVELGKARAGASTKKRRSPAK